MSETSDSPAPCRRWDAELQAERFSVRQPDGALWYDGLLPTSQAWRIAVRRTRHLDHYTTDHNALDPIVEDIVTGRALAVRSAAR
ncbi:hypothetical protein AB0B01_12520 [Streptomyces sp. NPDC044571]|uniref:hypothetical protein n=1 Tax=Streptomyces sp. NPDC044571 TaxID=3155371 RepID=UPI00340218DB